MDVEGAAAGVEAIRRLKAAEPPLFLSPSDELAKAARKASEYLFSALKPYSLNCPLPELVTDGFDAEQIWPQIEAQTEPLMKTIKTHFRKFEKNPGELEKQFNLGGRKSESDVGKKVRKEKGEVGVEVKVDGLEESDDDDDEEEDEDDEEEEEEDEEEEGEEEEGDGLRDVEDDFFKIKDLERYVEADEAREYGIGNEKKGKEKKRKKAIDDEDDEEDEVDEEDESEDEEDELGLMDMEGLDDDDELELAKYDDFFVGEKKIKQKKTYKLEGLDDSDLDERPNTVKIVKAEKKTSKPHEGSDDSDLDVKKKNLSTHEKEQEKLRSQIEEMERSNLEPKEWMMQGEVTARKRAINSALEVDLDFEHNVRPAPVITEEVTATLEELIQKRILEGRFNDVQKPPTLLNKAPKEVKEMDETKSKKGLAEVYEEEYVQKTGLVSAALSFSDEQKKEASTLFKKLCLKLDALSHFHFTPKPIIEDMSIQANVPALAMEEIAPMAVSDAAMLAPEEVFSGKGDIKEQTELTQAERKRRRANKKRKFKAESDKRMAGKAEKSTSKDAEGNEAS